MIPGIGMKFLSIATWLTFAFLNKIFQPEDNSNHLGYQYFGASTWPKMLSFVFFSVKNCIRISQHKFLKYRI